MPDMNDALARDRRDELDLSNADIAQALGISEGYAENILCGSDAPSRRVIYRLERALGLPKGALARTPNGDPSEPPNQPPNSPKAPPRRQEKDNKAPKRIAGQAVAS